MKRLNHEIDDLKKKSRTAKKEIKDDLKSQIAALENDANEVRKKIEGLEKSSENAWVDLKASTEQAFHILKRSFKNVKNKLEQKIK